MKTADPILPLPIKTCYKEIKSHKLYPLPIYTYKHLSIMQRINSEYLPSQSQFPEQPSSPSNLFFFTLKLPVSRSSVKVERTTIGPC